MVIVHAVDALPFTVDQRSTNLGEGRIERMVITGHANDQQQTGQPLAWWKARISLASRAR